MSSATSDQAACSRVVQTLLYDFFQPRGVSAFAEGHGGRNLKRIFSCRLQCQKVQRNSCLIISKSNGTLSGHF